MFQVLLELFFTTKLSVFVDAKDVFWICILQARADVNNIAILDEVFLALQPELALCLRFIHGPKADEVFVRHYLRPNESALKISMDLTRRLLRGGAAFRLPGAHFILPHCEERLQLQQIV